MPTDAARRCALRRRRRAPASRCTNAAHLTRPFGRKQMDFFAGRSMPVCLQLGISPHGQGTPFDDCAGLNSWQPVREAPL